MSELSPLDTGFLAMEDTDSHVSLGLGTVAITSGPSLLQTPIRCVW